MAVSSIDVYDWCMLRRTVLLMFLALGMPLSLYADSFQESALAMPSFSNGNFLRWLYGTKIRICWKPVPEWCGIDGVKIGNGRKLSLEIVLPWALSKSIRSATSGGLDELNEILRDLNAAYDLNGNYPVNNRDELVLYAGYFQEGLGKPFQQPVETWPKVILENHPTLGRVILIQTANFFLLKVPTNEKLAMYAPWHLDCHALSIRADLGGQPVIGGAHLYVNAQKGYAFSAFEQYLWVLDYLQEERSKRNLTNVQIVLWLESSLKGLPEEQTINRLMQESESRGILVTIKIREDVPTTGNVLTTRDLTVIEEAEAEMEGKRHYRQVVTEPVVWKSMRSTFAESFLRFIHFWKNANGSQNLPPGAIAYSQTPEGLEEKTLAHYTWGPRLFLQNAESLFIAFQQADAVRIPITQYVRRIFLGSNTHIWCNVCAVWGKDEGGTAHLAQGHFTTTNFRHLMKLVNALADGLNERIVFISPMAVYTKLPTLEVMRAELQTDSVFVLPRGSNTSASAISSDEGIALFLHEYSEDLQNIGLASVQKFAESSDLYFWRCAELKVGMIHPLVLRSA